MSSSRMSMSLESPIQVLFTEEERKKLKLDAAVQGVTMSELIRKRISDGAPGETDELVTDADSEIDPPQSTKKDELFNSRMSQIVDAMQDANYQPSEVLKLIALEQAMVVNAMSSQNLGWGFGGQGKRLEIKHKALSQLAKTVQDAEELSKKDILNLDGPKFEHCWGKFIDWMRNSMTEAGLNDETGKSVLVIFRDKASNGQEELQKELDAIDSN